MLELAPQPRISSFAFSSLNEQAADFASTRLRVSAKQPMATASGPVLDGDMLAAREATHKSTRECDDSRDLRPAVKAILPSTASPAAVNCNALELRGYSYLCAWVGVVGLHLICAVYLMQLARVYSFYMHPYMEYWATLITRDRHVYFGHIGVVLGAISALHWWQILCVLYASFRARELVLLDESSGGLFSDSIHKKLTGHKRNSARMNTVLMSARFKKLTLPSRFVFKFWKFFFSRHGVFGIESDFFPVVFIAREVVEIVSQTFQAHRSSESLPRPWLNNLLVTLVVVNCWSTPILQRFLRHHQGTERVVCLILDVLLNMGSSIFIPIIIFSPYYEVFIPEAFSFPFESLYDALFFSRLVMENQLLFSLSSADIYSRILPHLGIYSSLASASTLIHRKGSTRKSRVLSAESIEKSKPGTFSKTNPDAKAAATATSSTAVGSATRRLVAHTSRNKKTLVHAFFGVWGLVVLVLHVRGVIRSQKAVLGCRQVTGSWFTKEYPCSVYTYNCYRQGTATPDEDSWKHLDESSLVYLTIAHCPELKVPHRIQNFPNLLGLQLHNTTIVEWKKENALSATKHKKIVVLVITKTNMTRIPDGMLQPLPPTLVDIEMAYTNLTMLPDNLHETWHQLSTLYFEHSLITEFPKTLLSMQLQDLSLHGNLIEKIPELAHTPLPETLGEGTVFTYFSAERTLIKTLPAWAYTSVEAVVYLYGTPYCETQPGDVFNGTYLACVKRDNRPNGKVPLEIIDPRIPL